MYSLYLIKVETGNYEKGDAVIAKISDKLEGYIVTSKDDLIKIEYVEKVELGSDRVCSEE